MLRTEATGEASVCPWPIEVVVRIAGAAIMADPLIIAGVNVRNAGMTVRIHRNTVLDRSGLTALCRSRRARRPGSPHGSRAARRNVSASNGGVTAAALLIAAILLCKSNYADHADES